MLTVSLVGKKFSCSIQLQISAEKEGGALELALKAGEKCNNCPQSVSNVNATLNITIQKGCSNYVTKCKEMLMFLQEQALPKTMNIMKVHLVNREMKNIQKDDTRLFSCIKQKKRERERHRDRSLSTDRLTTRGYSSDTDQAIRHSCTSGTEHYSRMDILATPRMSRHKLKNAALLRNRKNREASKERESIQEKDSKPKNQTIQIKLKDPRKSRSTAVKKVETEFDKEGSLIYEGSSESSLCDLSKEASCSSKTKGMKDSEESELDFKDNKATESDMSVDSLECLDIEPSKYEAKKRKRKKPPRSVETLSQADKDSKPSKASSVPPLVFPSDLYDWSSSELSDTKCHTEPQSEPSENKDFILDSNLVRTMKESAQEIVQKVISSAITKSERRIPTGTLLGPNSENTTAVFSNESVNDDNLFSKDKNISKVSSDKTIDISHKSDHSFKDEHVSESIPTVAAAASLSSRENITSASYTVYTTQPVLVGAMENAECRNEVKQSPTCTPRSTQTSPIESTFNNEKDVVSSKTPLERDSGPQVKDQGKDIDTQKNDDIPVKLYDSHDNITRQIIHSVSRALNLNTKLVTQSSSHVLISPVTTLSRSCTSPDVARSSSQALVSSASSRSHVLVTQDSFSQASEQYSIHKDLMSRSPAMLEKPIELQIELSSSLQKYGARNDKEISIGSQKDVLGNSVLPSTTIDDQDSLIEEFCKKLPYSSKEISYKINSSSDQMPTSGYCFFIIGPDENVQQKLSPDKTEKKDVAMHAVESVQRRRKTSLYRRSLSHQNERKKWQTTADVITKVHHRSLSADAKSKAVRASKCASCPVLSEEDIVLEGLESHHQDVCNSLSQRTWIALRVHELWKANKHEEALKTCMELTGVKKAEKSNASESLSGSSTALDLIGNKDIVLFLNILQQLPIAGAAWTLDMCDLILPELKLFISTRIHTSHVEMTCSILQVIVKKVSGAVLKAQSANKKNSLIAGKCVNHLQDIRERASKVLMARRPRMYCTVTTEDPIALKPVLRELLTVIQTLLSVYTE